jgi:hypothetical protein
MDPTDLLAARKPLFTADLDAVPTEDALRKELCAFHEERLNWRLQRAFEDCFPGRAFQQRRPTRPRPVAVKPQGFA